MFPFPLSLLPHNNYCTASTLILKPDFVTPWVVASPLEMKGEKFTFSPFMAFLLITIPVETWIGTAHPFFMPDRTIVLSCSSVIGGIFG
jgi:hypothetical protein